jgi:sugar phosphate isomerase/epimerase
MKEQTNPKKQISRRGFIGTSVAALAAISVTPRSILAAAAPAATKPNSVFNGVHIGAISYSMKGVSGGAEATLAAFVEAGLSEIELMSDGGYMSGQSGGGGRGGAGGGMPGGMGGGMGARGGMQMIQRPSQKDRLAAVEALEKQVTTLKTQIAKAPLVDPNIAGLSGNALTDFMNVYAPESNTINEMGQTLTKLSSVNVTGGGMGGMMGGMIGGRGGLTEESLTELLTLAKQDNATKLAARLETMSQQVQAANPAAGGRGGAAGGRGGAGGGGMGGGGRGSAAPLTEAELQTQRASRYIQLARAMDLRKMYNDAGVNIHFHKIGFGSTEEEYTWAANVAKAFGAIGMTAERPNWGQEDSIRTIAPFAEKTGIWAVYHSHTGNYPQLPEDPLYTIGKYVGFNFDTGHYFAGTRGKNPCEIIEKYHDKIISIHLKDRTAEGGNLEWGKGTTPIKEILQLIARNKWPIFCDIELEYQYPGNSCIPEFRKCVDFCKNCLV